MFAPCAWSPAYHPHNPVCLPPNAYPPSLPLVFVHLFDLAQPYRDKNRGVVWEESIILLPHKVRFVFLSATIPNSKEFCGWIAKTHHQPCHVVYTDYR